MDLWAMDLWGSEFSSIVNTEKDFISEQTILAEIENTESRGKKNAKKIIVVRGHLIIDGRRHSSKKNT